MKYTTIQITKKFHKKLLAKAKKGESFEKVILRLIGKNKL